MRACARNAGWKLGSGNLEVRRRVSTFDMSARICRNLRGVAAWLAVMLCA
jgi:hypothetical protein